MSNGANRPGRPSDILALTTQIVTAHVSKNPIPHADVASVIRDVANALTELASGRDAKDALPDPAKLVRDTLKRDYIICLEDGKRFRTLRGHLMSAHNLTPEEYREKWNLPGDYPMVAPSYSRQRSALARQIGLGRGAAASTEAGDEEVASRPEEGTNDRSDEAQVSAEQPDDDSAEVRVSKGRAPQVDEDEDELWEQAAKSQRAAAPDQDEAGIHELEVVREREYVDDVSPDFPDDGYEIDRSAS